MKAVRYISLIVVAVVATLGLPAAAQPTADHVRFSGWSAAIEVSGLSEADGSGVEALWGEFVAGTPDHAACLLASPPRIEARSDMAPRAAYAPATGTLYVKPGDLERLVVFHELAHHLDFTCGAAEEVGGALREAQGIPAGKAWWQEGSPVTWPAEYFANAVAIALGETSRHDVAPGTVEVVEKWMGRASPVVEAPAMAPLMGDMPGLPTLI